MLQMHHPEGSINFSFLSIQHGPLKAAMAFVKRLTPTHCCRCTTQRAARWHCVTPARAASTCCAWAWSGRSCQRGTGPAPAVLSARACPPSASLWMKSRTGSPPELAGAFPSCLSVCLCELVSVKPRTGSPMELAGAFPFMSICLPVCPCVCVSE